ncbi:MAG: 4Fe-4S binding protein [Spirochaetaceae bacterium]|nr:4Fe-4S binding protein [Spirochaetaceae bacterium]
MKIQSKRFATNVAALLFVATISIGGFFFRELGLALAGLMAAALALTLVGHKPRVFCSRLCPRGRALGFSLKPLSRMRPLPRSLRSPRLRRLLCGAMMFCVAGNLFRGPLAAKPAGMLFWLLCLVSLSAGVVLGILYKPRAWCVLCPLGTLQDTVRSVRPDGAGGR